MYKHLLIPTDGSSLSEDAVRQGLALAKTLNADVAVLTVSPPFHTFSTDPLTVTETRERHDADCQARAERFLGFARDLARAAGVRCETIHVVNDHPWEAIIATAQSRGCDLILMASHGRRGVAALVLGSETTKVLTHSKIPTLVCR